MVLTIRSTIHFRILRQRLPFIPTRKIANMQVKHEINTELLNSFNQEIKTGGVVPVFRRALLFPTRIALQDELGIYTYAGLFQAASTLSSEIAAQLVGQSEQTIAYMCSNDASHIIVQWAIWMTGNIAVPLTPLHPPDMIKYFLSDCGACLVICTPEYEKTLRPISLESSKPLLITTRDKEVAAQLYQPNTSFLKQKPNDKFHDVGRSNLWYGKKDAMLIYTSGTTSKPKGVVWTHSMLATQIGALHVAWRYAGTDVVLHALPLHHIHGQLNSVLASLAAGARIQMLPKFVSHKVWSRLLSMGEREDCKVNVFHGVPAMYSKLLEDYDKMFTDDKTREYVRTSLSKMRLMCCGSAPLPATLADKWEKVSGMRLLERYGMSEVGMALSNPYRPIEDRTLGHVGQPLPGMEARVAQFTDDQIKTLVTVSTPEATKLISLEQLNISNAPESSDIQEEVTGWESPKIEIQTQGNEEIQGELLLRGPGVFTRYWNRSPDQLKNDFTSDGWFRTGDTVSYTDKFRILGRTSVDIIKTSGYKVSALQVESAILEHPSVADAAVLGIENEKYGEIVSAVVVVKNQVAFSLQDLNAVLSKKIAPYQLPRTLLVVKEMPRNIMGKLDKKEIKKLYGEQLALKTNN